MNSNVRDRLTWLGIALLALWAIAGISRGLILAWIDPGGDTDIYERLDEFHVFQQGVYPHRSLASNKHLPGFRTSVYPPYALPMFGAFFTWGGALQGRLMIQALSLASLGLIGWYGYRNLRFAGPSAGAFGALAGIVISGNFAALAQCQFSILCMGLITAQLVLLEQRRSLPAGLCWALAMIKPHIALPFALLLLSKRRITGLVVGIGLLLGLSMAAFWHTGVSPLAYLMVWGNKHSIDFITLGNTENDAVSVLINILGIHAYTAQLLVIGITICLAIAFILPLWIRSERRLSTIDTLKLASICAVIGRVIVYHWNHDNIMLYPALLSVLSLAIRFPSLWTLALSSAMAVCLWTPQRIMIATPLFGFAQLLTWIIVGVSLLLAVNSDNKLSGREPGRAD